MNGQERPEWPDLEHYAATPVYNTKAVVQQTGIPAPTLRAWERRYKIILPRRAENAYRLYSEQDIVLLRWLKERTDHGMSISQAIALSQYMMQKRQQEKGVLTLQVAESSIDYAPNFQVALETPERLPNRDDPEEIIYDNAVKPFTGPEEVLLPTPAIYSLADFSTALIDTFQRLDDNQARVLISTALAIYPIEQVCTQLIAPTLWQIGQLWARKAITVSIEHFASNFFRSLLTNLLYVMPNPHQGALAFVCSAPGEPHEMAALMLALFLRRRGLQVAYLGQSIESIGLLHAIRVLAPALVCISLTMPSYIPSLIRLSRQVQNLPEPRPLFIFGGQAFATYADIIPQIPGLYLKGGDLAEVADRLYCMIQEGTTPRD